MKFYPSGNNFTQALLVMLVTNIISVIALPHGPLTESLCLLLHKTLTLFDLLMKYYKSNPLIELIWPAQPII